MLTKIARYAIALIFGVTGYVLMLSMTPIIIDLFGVKVMTVGNLEGPSAEIVYAIVGGLIAFILGLILSKTILTWGANITTSLEHMLTRFSGQDLLFGAIGLAIGLIIANLIGLAFRNIPLVGPYIPVILSASLGYLGMHLMLRKRKDINNFWHDRQFLPHSLNRSKSMPITSKEEVAEPIQGEAIKGIKNGKLLDTSVVIDGRISDISHTGFLEGTLVAPLFVLEELQKLSDSSDALKRNRGRRGLDILQELQDDDKIDIILLDMDFDDLAEVDSKLMRLALDHGWKIITNDFNLNKVATLQGINVLNLNDLANALKPVRVPGEAMIVQVVKAGKENGQGIAYLEDGTMIVIEQGMKYVNETIQVVVTSILQTRAGRMIFARPEGVK